MQIPFAQPLFFDFTWTLPRMYHVRPVGQYIRLRVSIKEPQFQSPVYLLDDSQTIYMPPGLYYICTIIATNK